jgi:hypothetical protein
MATPFEFLLLVKQVNTSVTLLTKGVSTLNSEIHGLQSWVIADALRSRSVTSAQAAGRDLAIRLAYRLGNFDLAISWDYLGRLIDLSGLRAAIEGSNPLKPLGIAMAVTGGPEFIVSSPDDDKCFKLPKDEIAILIRANLVSPEWTTAIVLEIPLGFSLGVPGILTLFQARPVHMNSSENLPSRLRSALLKSFSELVTERLVGKTWKASLFWNFVGDVKLYVNAGIAGFWRHAMTANLSTIYVDDDGAGLRAVGRIQSEDALEVPGIGVEPGTGTITIFSPFVPDRPIPALKTTKDVAIRVSVWSGDGPGIFSVLTVDEITRQLVQQNVAVKDGAFWGLDPAAQHPGLGGGTMLWRFDLNAGYQWCDGGWDLKCDDWNCNWVCNHWTTAVADLPLSIEGSFSFETYKGKPTLLLNLTPGAAYPLPLGDGITDVDVRFTGDAPILNMPADIVFDLSMKQ